MKIVTQNAFESDPSAVLRIVRASDEVVVRADDGMEFSVRARGPTRPRGRSPLDVGVVPGFRLGDGESATIVREMREHEPQWLTEMLERRERAHREASDGAADHTAPPDPTKP